ncbi:exopolysaccharide biosynthesis protein [Pseudoxanthomonas winnipegensis]|nr:exopolysaccharide biosynthesis protein [Pseudoxanthomonas winnipegensis]
MTTSSADSGAATTRSLLDEMARGDPNERLRLVDLLADLQQSAFGMLLFIGVLPSFIPIPGVAGGLSGPLVMLVGAQLLLCLRKPWLPRFIAIRGPMRHSVVRFRDALAKPLRWLEKLVRPRWPGMLDSRLASAFTGLLLLLLGVLLALPIPFTNYLFGLLLLLYVFALLERDGMLLLAAWVMGAVAIAVFGVASGNLAHMVIHQVQRLF